MAQLKKDEFGVFRIQSNGNVNGHNENQQVFYKVGIYNSFDEAEQRITDLINEGENGPLSIIAMTNYVRTA